MTPWKPLVAVLTALLFQAPAAQTQAPARPSQTGVAYLAIDLNTGQVRDADQAGQLERVVAPGSLIKIATLAAALEAGAITPRTGLLCTREAHVAGQTLICAHPDLQRPLRAAKRSRIRAIRSSRLSLRAPRSVFDRVLYRPRAADD